MKGGVFTTRDTSAVDEVPIFKNVRPLRYSFYQTIINSPVNEMYNRTQILTNFESAPEESPEIFRGTISSGRSTETRSLSNDLDI